MKLQTNFNLSENEILELYSEVSTLAREFDNWYDCRIFTHPTTEGKDILNKALENSSFIFFIHKHLKTIDKTLIEFFKKSKALKMKNLKHITTPQNLMTLKEKHFIKRLDYYTYELTQEGLDYLIAKTFPYWCKFNGKLLPSQRIVIYRLALLDEDILPTQKIFGEKTGFSEAAYQCYERNIVFSPPSSQKIMKNIETNLASKLAANLQSKEKIKENFDLLSTKRYEQVVKAARLIHPRLKEKLTDSEYHLFQVSKLKNTKPTEQEQSILQEFKKREIKFELHPVIENEHFDIVVPYSNNPKIIIEAINTSYNLNKIDKTKKTLPKSIFIAITSNKVRGGLSLLFKQHFDFVFSYDQIELFYSIIPDILDNEIPLIQPAKVLAKVIYQSSNLWQGDAEKIVRRLLENNKFKLNKDYFHEPQITVLEDGNIIDIFKPDFLIKGKPVTIIEAMEVSKNTKKNRLNELSAKFEIYKRLLNSNNILVLFPKTKIETEELTILKNHCDRIFLNEGANRLPEILRGV